MFLFFIFISIAFHNLKCWSVKIFCIVVQLAEVQSELQRERTETRALKGSSFSHYRNFIIKKINTAIFFWFLRIIMQIIPKKIIIYKFVKFTFGSNRAIFTQKTKCCVVFWICNKVCISTPSILYNNSDTRSGNL